MKAKTPTSETAIESTYAATAFDTKPGAYSWSADTPSDPASSATKSVTREPIMSRLASPFPCRNDLFGLP